MFTDLKKFFHQEIEWYILQWNNDQQWRTGLVNRGASNA